MPEQLGAAQPKLFWADDAAGANKQELENWDSWTEPSPSTDEEEITDSSTPAGEKEKIPGDTDYGSIDLVFNIRKSTANPIGQNQLKAEIAAAVKTQRYFQVSEGAEATMFSGKILSAYKFPERGKTWKLKVTVSLDSALDVDATVWP